MSGSLTTSNSQLRITRAKARFVSLRMRTRPSWPHFASVVRTASPRLDLASLTMQVESHPAFSFNVDDTFHFLVDLFQAAAPDGTGLEEKESLLPSAILRRKASPSCLCSFSHSNGGHRTMTNHQSPRSGPSTIREEKQ